MSFQPKNPNGQAVMASSTPVVIASNQSTIPVSLATNTPTLQAGSTTAVTQATGSNLHMVLDSGTLTNLTQFNGTNITMKAGSTAAAATDPALVVAISPNNTVPVSLASVPSHAVTNAGTFAVQAAGNAANGAAVSGNPVLVGGSDGTNARTIKTATDGTLLINGVQDSRQAGTITTAASVVGPYSVSNRNVVTISISGTYAGVTFVIEATDDGANWYGLQSINNATGQAAATWTPGTNAIASYDSAVGGYTQIRVRATAWTSGTANVGVSTQVFAYDPVVAALSQGLAATGTAVTGNPVLVAGSDGTNARTISTSTTGAVNTNIAQMNGTTVSMNTGVRDAGTQRVTIATNDVVPVTGTFWQATQPVSLATNTPTLQAGSTTAVTQATGSNLHMVVDSGTVTNLTQFNGTNITMKAASTAAAATDPALVVAISPNNSVAVTGTFWQATQPVSIAAAISANQSGTWTVQPGNTANTTPWIFKLSDGTNAVNIKPASSSAVATDPSLVVALSPNSPIPAGTNAIGKLAANSGITIGAVELAAAQTLATVTNLAQMGGAAISMGTGVRGAGVQRVTVATDDIVQVKVVPDATSTYSSTNATTSAYAASLIVKASAGVLRSITGYNSKASGQFIQIHDSATLPADTAVPKVIFYVPATSNFSFDMNQYGRSFAAGIVICNSSTGPTKTIGAADCWFDVQYT